MMAQPLLISTSIVHKCLNDPAFLAKFPKFKPIQVKANNINFKAGCTSCAKRRADKVIGADFVRLLSMLDDAEIKAFKNYLGADKIIINGMNRVTKRFESIIK